MKAKELNKYPQQIIFMTITFIINMVQYIAKLKGKKSMLIVMHSDELDEIADGILEIRNGTLTYRN